MTDFVDAMIDAVAPIAWGDFEEDDDGDIITTALDAVASLLAEQLGEKEASLFKLLKKAKVSTSDMAQFNEILQIGSRSTYGAGLSEHEAERANSLGPDIAWIVEDLAKRLSAKA